MRAFLMTDQLNQLHWAMLKSVLVVLALLPIGQFLFDLLAHAEGSSQIMIGFFTISMMSASVILAFLTALKSTVVECDLVETKSQQWLFNIYRQVPMMTFVAIIMYLVSGVAF